MNSVEWSIDPNSLICDILRKIGNDHAHLNSCSLIDLHGNFLLLFILLQNLIEVCIIIVLWELVGLRCFLDLLTFEILLICLLFLIFIFRIQWGRFWLLLLIVAPLWFLSICDNFLLSGRWILIILLGLGFFDICAKNVIEYRFRHFSVSAVNLGAILLQLLTHLMDQLCILIQNALDVVNLDDFVVKLGLSEHYLLKVSLRTYLLQFQKFLQQLFMDLKLLSCQLFS